jgi:hypothetical protein
MIHSPVEWISQTVNSIKDLRVFAAADPSSAMQTFQVTKKQQQQLGVGPLGYRHSK